MKIFKLFLTLILFFTVNAAFSKELTFSVISDANIRADKANNSMTPSIKNLLTAKDDINRSDNDFVLFLGDNIEKTDKYDLVMFAKIIDMVSKPVYVGIGNQDTLKTKDLSKAEYYRLLNKFSKNKISKVPCVKKIGGFTFIFADGTSEAIPSKRGYFKDKELIWLDKALNDNKKRPVIIVQHFPLVPPEESSTAETYKGEDYRAMLKKHKNVKAVISGHFYKDFETTDIDGIRHISVPSLAKQGEYKVIKIREAGDDVVFELKTISVE